ncbi:class 3 adenylate cyclase [Natronoflexus pectinivorans]|uniref:Class 3 adenylate cyclase n=2 Tax=Natronoflexus pectinivorans TaxID=682526 RepID=A0A4R2GNP7_9BACT|nr:class 3 adenylate cyclase [Natronoflexus pectinivorans]
MIDTFYIEFSDLVSMAFLKAMLSFNISNLTLIFLFLLFAYVLYTYIRRQVQKKIEHLVNIRVEKALKVKEKAMQIRTGFDSESVAHTKDGTKVKSVKYKSVTVLFADIQGFTKIVEHLNPDLLIDELDDFFIKFDSIVEKHGVEKIKTIGDAYMAAGGIPEKNRIHALKMILVALEIQNHMVSLRSKKIIDHQDFWELRIGIHTGPVISGRVGRNKTAPDIWGDTVNIASRMESSGIAGEINVTGATYQLVKDFFVCEYRGKMPIKYKGEIDMYFVKGIVPELAEENKRNQPNELFKVRLQHIRFIDLEEAILERLENELPVDICYHNVKHTIDVVTQVEIIGRGEGVSEEELLLLKTAALMHDTGFLITYENHEQISIELCNDILPRFDYNPDQIERIIQLINVTRPKTKPANKLESIMKDADLDYLGRTDFLNLSENLFKELNRYNGRMSIQEWNKKQFDFISKHRYYTETARNMRQVNKDKQLTKLKQILPLSRQ